MKICKYTLTATTVALLTFFSGAAFSNNAEGFDALCKLIGEALEHSHFTEQQANYITSNLQQKIFNEDIIEAFTSLHYVDPENRYTIFKQAAEATIDNQWECIPMKIFLQPTVDNPDPSTP
jgi:hypothetical protein